MNHTSMGGFKNSYSIDYEPLTQTIEVKKARLCALLNQNIYIQSSQAYGRNIRFKLYWLSRCLAVLLNKHKEVKDYAKSRKEVISLYKKG